jgi:hypothetical protein
VKTGKNCNSLPPKRRGFVTTIRERAEMAKKSKQKGEIKKCKKRPNIKHIQVN